MAPHAEPAVPRRARRLVPAGLPRRGELIAACAVLFVLVHLLFAPLTLVLVVLLAAIGVTTRWRRWWLLWPALAGVAWILAIGPDQALAGFGAGPASVLRHLSAGRAAGDAGHPLGVFAGAGGWLPRQFPVALPVAAAETAVLAWLAWLRTDEWAVPPARPGVVAVLRAAVTIRIIRGGAVLTRDGCALGTVAGTGAAAELRWAEIASGLLVTGAEEQPVMLASLQLVHAALRLRKPVIVLDDGREATVAAALAAVCQATGIPLRDYGQTAPGRRPGGADAASPSQLWGRAGQGGADRCGADRCGADRCGADPGSAGRGGADPGSAGRERGAGEGGPRGRGAQARGGLADDGLGDWSPGDEGPAGRAALTGVIGERSAVLLPVGRPDLADLALASLTALAGDLRRIGVDGDALVWAPHAERLPARSLAALFVAGAQAGLAVLAGTTSPAAAAGLSRLAGVTLAGRIADPELAAVLAARTGTRLLPPSAAALAGRPPGEHRSSGPADYRPPGRAEYRQAEPASASASGPGPAPASWAAPESGAVPWPAPAAGFGPASAPAASPAPGSGPAPDLVPCPVVPPRVLLTLQHDEFVLAVSGPRPRHVAPGRLVRAGLPRPAPAQARGAPAQAPGAPAPAPGAPG